MPNALEQTPNALGIFSQKMHTHTYTTNMSVFCVCVCVCAGALFKLLFAKMKLRNCIFRA